MRNRSYLLTATSIILAAKAHAFLGTEMVPLLQLVAGQVQELERLSENIGIARENQKALQEINDGINKTVAQIRSIQSLIERTQNLNPTEIKNLADLNELLSRTKILKSDIEAELGLKVMLADQTIGRSALQSDTSYRMGQEMVQTGGQLSQESVAASPGRSAQISAAAGSAQMLSTGVGLQALAQLVQIQAMSLEFQKLQIERELKASQARKQVYLGELEKPSVGTGKVGAKK